MRRPSATALAAVAVAAAVQAGAVDLSPCTLTGSEGFVRADALCGTVRRPEDPTDPDGASVPLFVARIPSLSPTPEPDALTLINGGPGGSSVDLYADLAHAFGAVLRTRDIVVVDQRGTGRSRPLRCPALEATNHDYTLTVPGAASDAELGAAVQSCLDELDGDPRFYTTSLAVADLDAVRAALGYRQLNVYGVSYGTRVALHYLRRYPERVRALVLDGVVPPELALGQNVALNAERALRLVFQRCAEEPACRTAFGDPAATLTRLRADLGEAGVPLTVAHPVTGADAHIALGYGHLAVTLRLMSYAPETAALIPLVLDETRRGNYTPVASQALRLIDQLASSISYGMHNAVVCTEDVPFAALTEADLRSLGETYLGAGQVRALGIICESWPRGHIDDDFKTPVRAPHPTLILSGELDPITPPAYGEQVHGWLPNSLHIVGAGQGHGIVARGCVPRLVDEFVTAGRVDGLDVGCTRRLGPAAFFVNLMGPRP